jgi:hypothetical protein
MQTIETAPPPLMPLRDNKMLMPFYSPHVAADPEITAVGDLVCWSTDRQSLIGASLRFHPSLGWLTCDQRRVPISSQWVQTNLTQPAPTAVHRLPLEVMPVNAGG